MCFLLLLFPFLFFFFCHANVEIKESHATKQTMCLLVMLIRYRYIYLWSLKIYYDGSWFFSDFLHTSCFHYLFIFVHRMHSFLVGLRKNDFWCQIGRENYGKISKHCLNRSKAKKMNIKV